MAVLSRAHPDADSPSPACTAGVAPLPSQYALAEQDAEALRRRRDLQRVLVRVHALRELDAEALDALGA